MYLNHLLGKNLSLSNKQYLHYFVMLDYLIGKLNHIQQSSLSSNQILGIHANSYSICSCTSTIDEVSYEIVSFFVLVTDIVCLLVL